MVESEGVLYSYSTVAGNLYLFSLWKNFLIKNAHFYKWNNYIKIEQKEEKRALKREKRAKIKSEFI